MPAAPAVSCARCAKEIAHEHTGTADDIRPSLRSGLTAYIALSLETNSSCLHRQRIGGEASTRSGEFASADLTPATGARTTRFCRTRQRRSSCAPHLAHRLQRARPAIALCADAAASTASQPAFRDDVRPPLQWVRRITCTAIPKCCKAEYFCSDGLTGFYLLCPVGYQTAFRINRRQRPFGNPCARPRGKKASIRSAAAAI